MTVDPNDISSNLEASINRGIDYLHEHQLPNGEFTTYYSPDDEMQEWCVPDSTVFSTSVIGLCLLKLAGHQKVVTIHKKCVTFLQYQMMAGGVWNFFTKWNPIFKTGPADTDSTALACSLLRALGEPIPDNIDVFLDNCNSKGLFYTWFVSRFQSYKNLKSFKVMARELKRPLHTLIFWSRHEVGRNDLDAVVNANILSYLGLNDFTRNIPEYLCEVLRKGAEVTSDKWYKNPYTFYYFLSRNYAQVPTLEPTKPIVIDRILQSRNSTGAFGNSAMSNALCISTLLNLKYEGKELDDAVVALLASQCESGSWERHIFFYAGPSKIVGWGSEETVTGFALESLASYQQMKLKNEVQQKRVSP